MGELFFYYVLLCLIIMVSMVAILVRVNIVRQQNGRIEKKLDDIKRELEEMKRKQ